MSHRRVVTLGVQPAADERRQRGPAQGGSATGGGAGVRLPWVRAVLCQLFPRRSLLPAPPAQTSEARIALPGRRRGRRTARPLAAATTPTPLPLKNRHSRHSKCLESSRFNVSQSIIITNLKHAIAPGGSSSARRAAAVASTSTPWPPTPGTPCCQAASAGRSFRPARPSRSARRLARGRRARKRLGGGRKGGSRPGGFARAAATLLFWTAPTLSVLLQARSLRQNPCHNCESPLTAASRHDCATSAARAAQGARAGARGGLLVPTRVPPVPGARLADRAAGHLHPGARWATGGGGGGCVRAVGARPC
jgi:hypothetical protein